MHFLDYTVILVLALVLFGPKKLPEIARQIGKVMAELRRASNEFKFQMDEEMRSMEQQERQKKQEAEWSASVESTTPALAAPESTPETTEADSEQEFEQDSEYAVENDEEYSTVHPADISHSMDETADETANGEAANDYDSSVDSEVNADTETSLNREQESERETVAGEPETSGTEADDTYGDDLRRMPTASREFVAAHEAAPYPGYAKALADEQAAASSAAMNHGTHLDGGARIEASDETPAADQYKHGPTGASDDAQVTTNHG